MYTFYGSYYVYLCVYIVMRDYIYFTICLKRTKNADIYIHYYTSVYTILF